MLFTELRLPPSGDPACVPKLPVGRGGRRGPGRAQYSTSKDVLEILQKLHPLPAVILEWRRITNALTKTVFPIQKEKVELCMLLAAIQIVIRVVLLIHNMEKKQLLSLESFEWICQKKLMHVY